MKLGINSQDLQDIIMTRLDSMTNISSSIEGQGRSNPKLGLKTRDVAKYLEKVNMVQ
jgi:hypothetical protein